MKRTLLLILTLVVSAMSLQPFDDIPDRIAKDLEMTRAEVQTCFDKTNVTFEDLMQVDVIIQDDLRTVDFDDSALKAGCFFTCLCHKKGAMTGARVNVDRIKEIIRSKKGARPDLLVKPFQVLDTCVNRVNSKTNECEMNNNGNDMKESNVEETYAYSNPTIPLPIHCLDNVETNSDQCDNFELLKCLSKSFP